MERVLFFNLFFSPPHSTLVLRFQRKIEYDRQGKKEQDLSSKFVLVVSIHHYVNLYNLTSENEMNLSSLLLDEKRCETSELNFHITYGLRVSYYMLMKKIFVRVEERGFAVWVFLVV